MLLTGRTIVADVRSSSRSVSLASMAWNRGRQGDHRQPGNEQRPASRARLTPRGRGGSRWVSGHVCWPKNVWAACGRVLMCAGGGMRWPLAAPLSAAASAPLTPGTGLRLRLRSWSRGSLG